MFKHVVKTVGVGLAVVVALFVIEALRHERLERREEAEHKIADSNGGRIELSPPQLFVQVEERWTVSETRTKQVVRQGVAVNEEYLLPVEHAHTTRWRILPSTLDVKSNHRVETRFLGVLPGRVQSVNVALNGQFQMPAELLKPSHQGGTTKVADAAVYVGLGSVRTLEQIIDAKISSAIEPNARTLRFESAPRQSAGPEAIRAELPATLLSLDQPLHFEVALALRGGGSFSVEPLADRATITVDASWPHADFTLQGFTNALPTQRSITSESVHAEWLTTGLSSGLRSWYRSELEHDEHDLGMVMGNQRPIGLSFIDPIDVFALIERSLKYGFPLTSLCLGLLWFVLRRMQARTHVMHTLLMGMSLAVFFLLLLAFSEKMSFGLAYALGASAVTLLNVAFISGLVGWGAAVKACAPTAVCFGALYGLLASEDSALLFGSLFVFALLTAFMMLTRTLNWESAFADRNRQVNNSP